MSALPCPPATRKPGGRLDAKGRRKTAGQRDSGKLSSVDLSVLFFLAFHGPVDSLAEMCRCLSTDVGMLSPRINRLERLGLLEIDRRGRGRASTIKPVSKNGNPI